MKAKDQSQFDVMKSIGKLKKEMLKPENNNSVSEFASEEEASIIYGFDQNNQIIWKRIMGSKKCE